MTAMFTGALLPVCGVDVLIVAVQPWILASRHESQLYVIAFQLRFRRTIVLMAQDERGTPTYFGPAGIVGALRTLPFELIPWRRMPYRTAPPRSWKLPIPRDPPPAESTDLSSVCSLATHDDALPLPAGRAASK
jgi:hypothetical protein